MKTADKKKRTESGERNKAAWGRKMLFRKEMADHLHSKRFWIVTLLILATGIGCLYSAVSSLKSSGTAGDFPYLSIFTTGDGGIPAFMSAIALVGPLVGLAMGFDAVNSERANGTLNRLVSQPIYRDSVIIGKFLAGLFLISVMVFSIGIIDCSVTVIATGLAPQLEELYRIFVFLFFTVVYIAFWLALAIFFSVVCRHTATSAMGVIALWIFFTLFMSLVTNIISNAVYPLDTRAQVVANTYKNYNLQLVLNRFSPYYLYAEAASTIMTPSVRSVTVLTSVQTDGAIAGYLTFGQSLLLVWPHLVGLIALMVVAFVGSYIGFMRQEIRS